MLYELSPIEIANSLKNKKQIYLISCDKNIVNFVKDSRIFVNKLFVSEVCEEIIEFIVQDIDILRKIGREDEHLFALTVLTCYLLSSEATIERFLK